MTQPDIGVEVFREQEALLASPGWRVYSQLKEMQFTFALHAANYMQLKSWSAEIVGDSDDNTKQILELWDARHRERFHAKLTETCRLLHNFLASSKMLVDHTRNHARDFYRGHPFQTEYEAQKGSRLTTPLCKFVHQLRDYNLHYRFPMVQCTMKWEGPHDNSTIRSDVVIDVKAIRHWNSWSPVALQFIDSCQTDPSVSLVAEQYMEANTQFYLWMWNREREIWREELREVEGNLGRLQALTRQAFPDMYEDDPVGELEREP